MSTTLLALEPAAGQADASVLQLQRTPGGILVPPGAGAGTGVEAPDLSGNPAITAALGLHADFIVTPQGQTPLPAGAWAAPSARAQPSVVLSMPTPAVIAGRPELPSHHARCASSSSAVQGPGHIRAIADPDPVWDPATSGWFTPPPASGVGDARWSVQSLPDPGGHPGGYYWLGDPSGADGTSGIEAAAQAWAPDRSTPSAPSWHSFFPYKPSVRAAYSYLPGGKVVYHPKGVHFNSHFIEHMWLDWGGAKRQPFSWVMAAMINAYPSRGFRHHLLDAGRDPDAVGFPRISDYQTGTPRTINDGLAYRNLLAVDPSRQTLCARPDPFTGHSLFGRVDTGLRPKMYFGVFNGANSLTGVFDPGAKRIAVGTIDNGGAQEHRYYVMGRSFGLIAQTSSSHVLVFELRFWHRALSQAELGEQYGQLASTYRFNSYRAV